MKTVIGVWFSKGAASAVAAKKTIEIYGKYHDVIIINNPVDEEDADNILNRTNEKRQSLR